VGFAKEKIAPGATSIGGQRAVQSALESRYPAPYIEDKQMLQEADGLSGG